MGRGHPFGAFGLSLAYDDRGTFSGGFGMGLDSLTSRNLPPLGVFGRARLLRRGRGSLGAGIALSREVIKHDQLVGQNWSTWNWIPAYRATATLGAELAGDAWSLRLDAGIGYLLNRAACSGVDGSGNNVSDSCDSPRIPAELRSASQAARWVPTLTVTVGYRFPSPIWPAPPSDAAEVAPGYRSPGTALHLALWSTVVPALAGSFMLGLSAARDNDLTLAVAGLTGLGLAFSLGPCAGYSYAGEPLRGWGVGALRLLGIGLGSWELLTGLRISSHDSQEDPRGPQALGLILISASMFSAIHDIITVPDAARRTNARNGLTNLSLVPTVLPGRGAASPGVSLMGRF